MLLKHLLPTLTLLGSAALLGGACAVSTPDSGGSDNVDGSRSAVTDCEGSYGKTPAADGNYDATSFGCWVDDSGNNHSDSGDNCIPACLATAKQSICQGMSGPECERSINWYSADAARYGCLARLKVTNSANGKTVVVVALDYGPSCALENQIDKPLLDLSYPATNYLFGSAQGYKDGAAVHVEVVSVDTPLGPTDGSSSTSSGAGSSSSGSGSGGGGAPDGWTCDPSWYADNYCDCNCGAADPDCGSGECDSSGSGGGSGIPAGWTCDPTWYADATYCDCDCGVDDPDCSAGQCDGSGGSGTPAGWTCDPTWYADGVYCDCNCGVDDPDCSAGQC